MRKLLAPNTRAIGRPAGPPTCDAVPATMLEGTPPKLRHDLVGILGAKQVLHRIIDLVRYAADASPYRLVPQVVVLPRNTADVANVLAYCRENGRHATFRAAGTSLNGQSQSDDILIDVRRNWSGCSVEDGGGRLRSRPGTILAHANARLRKYGRRLGLIETELFALKLTRPMTSAEKDAFCEIAKSSLNYQSNSYRIREIRLWVESWQSLWLPEKLGPDEGGGAGDD